MATAVRETPRLAPDGSASPDPDWDWWAAARRGDTDAVTARAAWRKRVAWRLAHPDAWRDELRQLEYFDPAYTYDEAHEYAWDWTTDPHLGVDVHQWIIDEDGFVSPRHYRHAAILLAILHVFRDMLGNRVEQEPEVHFDPVFGARAGLRTERGRSVSRVEPDLVVLPRELQLPEGVERDKVGRTMRLDQGHPIPELVVEILSPSAQAKDLRGKMHLYADLGIAEYLTCDPGGEPEPNVPAELRLYRLQPDSRFHEVEASDGRLAFIGVCGTHVRLWQPDTARPPRFQWWDAGQGRWRDQAADAEFTLRETRVEGEARGRTDMAVDLLHKLLSTELSPAEVARITAAWRRDGPPDNAIDRILAVRQAPDTWRSVLEPDADTNDDRRPDHTPSPRAPRPPRGR